MRLWAWGQSDPGRKRERNEDSYLVDPETGVLAVADGMGGHQGGATASRMAVELLASELAEVRDDFDAALDKHHAGAVRHTEEMQAMAEPTGDLAPTIPVRGEEALAHGGAQMLFSPELEVMRGVVRRASGAIFEHAWAKPELRGMGTTLTAILIHGGKAHLAHAGDSRCYMFRDGQLRQISDDHSWIAEQLKAGSITLEEAKASKFRHVITKSIGFERDTDADLKSVSVSPGDCFLLCSDGMSNYVEHGELERIIAMTWYRKLPETLIALANDRGGDDNITVVVGLISNA
ncbi:MAG: protein phosphatase 2C domain-containing protein [Kofleriaceae bacterium]